MTDSIESDNLFFKKHSSFSEENGDFRYKLKVKTFLFSEITLFWEKNLVH